MKIRFIVSFLLIATASAHANNYLVEPMHCVGQLTSSKQNVHSDYHQVLLVLKSFQSTRRDQTLAPSLEAKIAYFGPNQKVDKYTQHFSSIWYLGPLTQKGSQVFRKGFGRYDSLLSLKIVQSSLDGKGYGREKLVGTWSEPGSVAGPMTYQLECSAQVVQKTSTILDFTRN